MPSSTSVPVSSARHFLFLLGSARRNGNSEALARAAAAQLPPPVGQCWLALDDHALPVFADLRHTGGVAWTPSIEGEARVLLDATLAASDLVFVTPIYWYAMSASTKLYLDHWTAWLRAPGVEFRARMAGKRLWLVSTLTDEPSMALPLQDTFKLIAEYMQMEWRGMLLGAGNRPGDIKSDAAAMDRANGFFS